MDFVTAIKRGFAKVADRSGTATRDEFWWYLLAVVMISVIIGTVFRSFMGVSAVSVWALVFTGLMLSVTVRRLRDLGKPEVLAFGFFGLVILASIAQVAIVGLTFVLWPLTALCGLYLLNFLVQPGHGAYTPA